MTSPSTVWPTPCRSGLDRSAPSSRSRSRCTSRGFSMRCFETGTTAAASSRSTCTPRGTAMATARSDDSATVSRPIGLSSRTTSPVSVTHDVVCRPPNESSTRNAGTGLSSTRTTSRAPTTTRHRRVPHRRRIEHRPLVPGALGQALAGQTAREAQHQGRRFGERAHLLPRAAAAGDRRASGSRRRACPRPRSGRCRGRARTSNDFSAKAWSTRAVVFSTAALVAPSSDICRRPSSCSSNPSSFGRICPTVNPIFSPR